MKVLVTGGSGFIGSAVIRRLVSQGDQVVVLDRVFRPKHYPDGVEIHVGDIRDATATTESVAHVDAVIHLAGVLGTAETIQNPVPAAETNVLGGLNVLAAAGLSVPDDISAVGYDGIYLSQVMAPPLTTYKQDTVRLGTAAAEQLVNLIERPKVTLPVQLLVEGTLLKGKTVRQL